MALEPRAAAWNRWRFEQKPDGDGEGVRDDSIGFIRRGRPAPPVGELTMRADDGPFP